MTSKQSLYGLNRVDSGFPGEVSNLTLPSVFLLFNYLILKSANSTVVIYIVVDWNTLLLLVKAKESKNNGEQYILTKGSALEIY